MRRRGLSANNDDDIIRGTPGSFARLDILLVDDDGSLRQAVRRMLERQGHTVREAANGVVAVRLLEEERFDLVITDVVMPDMEGLELVRRIRRMDQPPRILVISGGGGGDANQYLALAAQFGADALLPKPFSAQWLAEAIIKAMIARP
jgi:CheY-like chemotaxis protein